MSKKLATVLKGIIDVATLPMNERQRNKTLGSLMSAINRKGTTTVSLPKGDIKFFSLRGSGIASAVITYGQGKDEPETMEWIDGFKDGDTLWDIGASIGLYALYAALNPKINILAFEPGNMDFSLLNEHIAENNMSKNLKAYCIALSGETKLDTLYMNKFETGCGGNAVGKPETHDREFKALFEQAIPAYTGDDLRKIFKLDCPDHIKLDVDGIEEDILKGLKGTLPNVKSIIVEIEASNLEFIEERIEKHLFPIGFEEDLSCREKGCKRNRIYINKNVK